MNTERSGEFFARRGRRLAQAMTSPSTIVATGAVAAQAIAGGVAFPVVGVAALGAYLAKVAASTWRPWNREGRRRRLDLGGLRPPYLDWVQRGMAARDRFRQGLTTTEAGPLKERFLTTAGKLDDTVFELERIARRAQGIDDYLSSDSVAHLDEQARVAESRLGDADDAVRSQREQTLTAVRDQLRVAQRLRDTYDLATSKMEATAAKLDQLVAQLMEVLLTSEDAAALPGAESSVDALIDELDNVREALVELDAPERLPSGIELPAAQPQEATATPKRHRRTGEATR